MLVSSWKSVVLCLLISSTVLAFEKKKTTTTTPKPTSPTTPTTSTSTEKPTSTTPTPAPTTTAPPTTTTPAPTTSTTPIPTTHAPTPPISTTTVKPSPPAPIGKWNSSCIMIQMAATFNITYQNKDNKTASGMFDLPADATVLDSVCTANTPQQIVLAWGPKYSPNTFFLQFDANGTKYYLYDVNLKVDVSGLFPDAKANQTFDMYHIGKNFSTPISMSYHCTRAQIFNMTKSLYDPTVVGTVTLRSVQLEAFRNETSTTFSRAKDCDEADTPDIVPIAVGIALAMLILVVLITYLVARQRRITRGYTSF